MHVSVGAEPVLGIADVVAPRPSLALGVSGGGSDDSIVQHGGPYLAMGLRGTTAPDDEGRFALRVGYELALVEHVIGSIAFETDFDSILESVLVEIASPELAILIPSFAAGVGLALRQLGQRDADAALRLHIGANVLSAGVAVDLDYWPAIADWTLTAVARVSV
mgnify:CR=1 FL=1